MRVTNNSDISLPLAVWLLYDDYDYNPMQGYISATSLMQPLRPLILKSRVPVENRSVDVADLIARTLGHAIHDSIEKAWKSGNYKKALQLLGYPEEVADRIRINPTDQEVRGSNSIIPIYLEQRIHREIEVDGVKYTIGSRYDMVTEGLLQDTKSTSTYAWTDNSKDDDYKLQMSIYRWTDAAQPLPKIQEDYGVINFIFTDWQKYRISEPGYPQSRLGKREIPLMSLAETEQWIRNKLSLVKRNKSLPEDMLPECSDEDLWRSDPKFKYYADPTKTDGKSTKNFETLSEANRHRAEKGKGVVITKLGEPKRCGYCDAFSICSQARRYFPA